MDVQRSDRGSPAAGTEQTPIVPWSAGVSRVPKAQYIPVILSIPAGPFRMGSAWGDPEATDDEKPQREPELEGYQIGRFPVTNAEYACFVLAGFHRPPDHWPNRWVPEGLENHPVVNVSWEDAEAYCEWISQITGRQYRLPTEEEWEKAARGGLPETRRYPWGDEWRSETCNTIELARRTTCSVHEFEQVNASPFGAVDMAGNVLEWTDSFYECYPGSPHASPDYGRVYRIVRGGSWQDSRSSARVSCRGRRKPDERHPDLGFRVALDAGPVAPQSGHS
jgi:formylglycine-generating enzyme required for sulfatase activity